MNIEQQKNLIKIGIKYCGGCNSHYDRTHAVRLLTDALPEAEYVYDTSVYCPVWLLICGCPNSCVDSSSLPAKTVLTASSLKEVLAMKGPLRDLFAAAQENALTPSVHRLTLGARVSRTRVFTQAEVRQFAALTGDTNGVHLDPETADLTLFRKPVVHGIFAASMFSGILGTELPGNGTILLEEHIQYDRPIFPEEPVTAEITFVSYTESRSAYIGVFEGVCRKADGTEAVRGTFRELMSKKFFRVERCDGNDQ